MQQYQYTLQKGGQKHYCPNCSKKRFVRYVDTHNHNQPLPAKYGRCDREISCGYHLNPYQDGFAQKSTNEHVFTSKNTYQPKPQAPKPIQYIPTAVLEQTLKGYEHNIFIQNLLERVAYPFEVNDIEKVIELYYLGTITKGYYKGAVTFPFIDKNKNLRAIQLKQFDESNHTKRTSFLHALIERHYQQKEKPLPQWLKAYKNNNKKVSCLFGEHLLSKYPYNPIALVEAPKTAIYGTLYFGVPSSRKKLLWMAVYNLSSLSFEKCKVLEGRTVCLFPDLSKDGRAFELWSKRAKTFEAKLPNTKFIVSDLLEINASTQDRIQGLDLADYLIKQDWRKYRLQQPTPKPSKVEEQKTTAQPQTKPIKTTAFVDAQGQLYIQTPIAPTYAIYPSIEAYNKRQCLPTFKPQKLIDTSQYTPVSIQLPTMTIDRNVS